MYSQETLTSVSLKGDKQEEKTEFDTAAPWSRSYQLGFTEAPNGTAILGDFLQFVCLITNLCVCVCMFSLSVLSTSIQPMDYSPPGSSAHGLLQAKILEGGEALIPSQISLGHAETRNRSIASRGRLDLSQSRQWPD